MNPWIEKMKKTGRQTLTIKQTVFHYFFALAFPLVCIGICDVILYFSSMSEINKVYISGKVLTYASYIGLAYLIRQYMSLSMSFVPFEGSHEQFASITEKMVRDNHWVIESIGEDYYVCTIPFKWTNWGTLMTIVKSNDGVFFNSICDLHNRPSTTSFGQNARNMKLMRAVFEQKIS